MTCSMVAKLCKINVNAARKYRHRASKAMMIHREMDAFVRTENSKVHATYIMSGIDSDGAYCMTLARQDQLEGLYPSICLCVYRVLS